MMNLNLLDPGRKNILREQGNAHAIASLMAKIIFLMLVDIGVLVILSTMTMNRRPTIEQELATTRVVTAAGKIVPLSETRLAVNQQLRSMKPLLVDYRLDTAIAELAQHIPENITLSRLSLSGAKREVILEGTAATRNDMPLFERALAESGLVERATNEWNFNERNNIPFLYKALTKAVP